MPHSIHPTRSANNLFVISRGDFVEHQGGSNHRTLNCLFNRLSTDNYIKLTAKKSANVHITHLWWRGPPVTDFIHTRPVMPKLFPCNDIAIWKLGTLIHPHQVITGPHHLPGWQKGPHGREQMDGLLQERRNSIANALELHLSCTAPLKYSLK